MAAGGAQLRRVLPKIVVFDLDNCCWDPEMYQLWGGGAPFKYHEKSNTCTDRAGVTVRLMGAVVDVWHTIATDPAFGSTQIAIASCCDEPEWAEECLRKFRVGDEAMLTAGMAPTMNELVAFKQIHKGSKKGHLREIARDSGVALEDMVFFDDQRGNISDVSSLGVLSILTPNGVEGKHWVQCLDEFEKRRGGRSL
mmetsp:Transcript_12095/g.31128  ORF Transcript_12095/g.31128 Transcript_12095/m.31128 type:complete len:196 (-) Transcript_12095:199-786(-)